MKYMVLVTCAMAILAYLTHAHKLENKNDIFVENSRIPTDIVPSDFEIICAKLLSHVVRPVPIIVPLPDNVNSVSATVQVRGEFLVCDRDSQVSLQVIRTLSQKEVDTNKDASQFEHMLTLPIEVEAYLPFIIELRLPPGSFSLHLQGLESGEVFHSMSFEVLPSPIKFSDPLVVPVLIMRSPNNEVFTVRFGRGTYPTDLTDYNYKYMDQVPWEIEIGNFCSFALQTTFVMPYSKNHNYHAVSTYPLAGFTDRVLGYQHSSEWLLPSSRSRSRKIAIGSDVWVGMEVAFIGTVTVGHGAVIGAYSVVRGDIPPYAIVIGNPAQVIGYRFSESVVVELLELRWWDKSDEDVELAMRFGEDIEGMLAYFRER